MKIITFSATKWIGNQWIGRFRSSYSPCVALPFDLSCTFELRSSSHICSLNNQRSPMSETQALRFTPAFSSQTIIAALDSAAVSLPIILGSTVILFAQVAPSAMGAGFFVAFMGVAWVTLLTSHSGRPIAYAARFFEAATLATLVLQMASRLPQYGLQDTEATRLGLLCGLSAMAGLVVGLLWLLRAERLARFIPVPVYIGFASAIAVAVVISQLSSLKTQISEPQVGWQVAAAVVTVVASALAVKRLRPHWPASAFGLLAGIVVGMLSNLTVTSLPRLVETQSWMFPVQLADFTGLWGPDGNRGSWWLDLLKGSGVLGVLVFLNNVATGEQLAQLDDKRTLKHTDKGLQAFALASAGVLGSPNVSGSIAVSLMAARSQPLNRWTLYALALLMVALCGSTALTLVPVAALSGMLLVEAWQLWDRASARQALLLLCGRPVERHHKEDLMVIAGVMAASLLVNMVAALLVGLLLGLVLHAHRNTQRPVRRTLSGLEIQSNCARTPAEFEVLAQHGSAIRVLQLDSHQFFASVALLQDAVRQAFFDARFVILDWTAVRQIDSSIAQGVGRLQEQAHQLGIALVHAGTQWKNSNVYVLLSGNVPATRIASDLDRALESVENLLLQNHLPPFQAEDSHGHLLWPAHLSDAESQALRCAMSLHLFEPGECFIREGEASDALWFITRGQASIQLATDDGTQLRVSGVRAGTTVGQIGFIDRQARSASVVAETTVEAMRLNHASFQLLSQDHPTLVQKLLSQLSIDLATHLRASNLHALAQAHHVMA